MPSMTNVKGVLQITEVNLQSSFKTEKVLIPCVFTCSISWISENLARKMEVQGAPLKLTVNGINSHQTIDTQIVKLKLTPVHSGGSCPSFVVKPYKRKDLNVGTEINDVDSLQVYYPQSEPILLKKYTCGDVVVLLGQDKCHACFRRRTERILTSLPFTGGLDTERSTPLDFRSFLDVLHGCYSK